MAMFMSSFWVDTNTSQILNVDEIQKFDKMYLAFFQVKYTHLTTALMILLYQYAKIKEIHILSGVVGVFFPINYFLMITWKANVKYEVIF